MIMELFANTVSDLLSYISQKNAFAIVFTPLKKVNYTKGLQ
jgi:hypothetical protein